MNLWLYRVILMVVTLALFSQGLPAHAEKYAYVDLQKALQSSEAGRKAKDLLTARINKLQAEVTATESQLKSLKGELEKPSTELSAAVRSTRENAYQAKLKDYQRFVKESQDGLQAMNDAYTATINDELSKIVKTFGKSRGYAFVFALNEGITNKNWGEVLVYKNADQSLLRYDDVTDTILALADADKSLLAKITGSNPDSSSNLATTTPSPVMSKPVAKEEYPAQVAASAAAKPANRKAAPPRITMISPELHRGVTIARKTSNTIIIGKAASETGIADVTVNGQQASLDADGNFSSELLLKVGENRITVVAIDTERKTTTETFTINREAGKVAKAKADSTVPPPSSKTSGKNYALVIGINQYQQIDRLKTAVNDAKGVARVLKGSYGFEIRELLDAKASRTAIMKELNELKNRLNPEDRLLIYYAGHGFNDPETETSYWLPVEADKGDPTNWINAKDITDQLKRSRARQVLIVADSCYSGTMSRAVDASLAGKGTREHFLQKLMEKPSRVLIASGGNEPVADSGGKNHSIFAEVFIDALQNPSDSIFTAEELLTGRIKESVAGRAEQTPEYKVIRNSGHNGGDFVFIKQ